MYLKKNKQGACQERDPLFSDGEVERLPILQFHTHGLQNDFYDWLCCNIVEFKMLHALNEKSEIHKSI